MVPGSHRWPENPPLATTADVDDAVEFLTVPIEMSAESVCFVHDSTYHGGGANVTDKPPVGMTLAYCAP